MRWAKKATPKKTKNTPSRKTPSRKTPLKKTPLKKTPIEEEEDEELEGGSGLTSNCETSIESEGGREMGLDAVLVVEFQYRNMLEIDVQPHKSVQRLPIPFRGPDRPYWGLHMDLVGSRCP